MKRKVIIIVGALLFFIIGVTAGELGIADKFFGNEVDIVDLRTSTSIKNDYDSLQEIVYSERCRTGTNFVLYDVTNSKGEVVLEAGTEIITCWIE